MRGAELLAGADVVVHDRLSAAELLDLAPPGAERIDVGKAPAGPSMPQERDQRACWWSAVAPAATVVRLKGGDPFVFARGGEEAAALQAAGVDYEVVPGITSAIAAPAYAGIPVTLRYSSTIVHRGHRPRGPDQGPDGDVDWEAVARVGGTIVILMGVGRTCRRSPSACWPAGWPPDTPAAAVRWGTRPDQHTIRATLATLARPPAAAAVARSWSATVAAERAGLVRAPPAVRPSGRGHPGPGPGRRSWPTGCAGWAPRWSRCPTIEIAEPSDGGAALRDAVPRRRRRTTGWC